MLYDFLKRTIDIVLSLIGLVILAPFLIVFSLAIKLDSEGPILADTPERVGRNGQLFKMYKFRSMIKGAQDLLRKDPKLLAEYKKNSYKLRDDPRVTRMGKILRRFSIDEFPQLMNILRGEMSLVGPRAYYPFELEEQQEKYPKSKEFVKIILSTKPGATGVWQVSGRSDINFDKRVEMDAQYVQRRSVLFDLYLILKTVPAVIIGRGAI